MLQVIDIILFIALAYMALMLGATLPLPNYTAEALLLLPLIGLVAAVWAFVPRRKRLR
jgi:hypothetical protein